MRIYTIYHNTSDYGDKYVARGVTVGPGITLPDPEPIAIGDTLEAVQDALPPGLVNLGRKDEDDPVIVEVWI